MTLEDTGELVQTEEEDRITREAIKTFLNLPGSPTCAGCPAPILTGFVPNDGHTLVYCAACRAHLDAQVDE